MARRTDIDWSPIQRAYRLGNQSNKQLSEVFKVDAATIGRKAKKDGWVQDKRKDVQAVTDSVLIQATANATPGSGNATPKVNPNATPTALEIKVAGTVAAEKVMAHRVGLRRLADLWNKLVGEIELMTDNSAILQEFVEAIDESGPTDSGGWYTDKKAAMMQAILGSPDRIDSLKKLAEIDERIRKGEREAFGIQANPGDEPDALASLIASFGRSALPVVHEVPDDV